MKFCRFELVAEPGSARTGIAYEGRVYETDGTNAIGIHEAADVRLLEPIGRAPSVRVFRSGQTVFDYAHPAAMLGPNVEFPMPAGSERLGYVPSVAIVVGGAGRDVPTSEADDLVLGLTLCHVFTALIHPGGRALDAGYAVGPAIVTPDEFLEGSIREEAGAAYPDAVTLWRNAVEVAQFELGRIVPRPAKAIAVASESFPLLEGDLLVIPLGEVDLPVDSGDEIRLSGATLGSLTVRIG